jgi:energy-converting hydrogenase Eha subunit G
MTPSPSPFSAIMDSSTPQYAVHSIVYGILVGFIVVGAVIAIGVVIYLVNNLIKRFNNQ